jgi:hypothetical protein
MQGRKTDARGLDNSGNIEGRLLLSLGKQCEQRGMRA